MDILINLQNLPEGLCIVIILIVVLQHAQMRCMEIWRRMILIPNLPPKDNVIWVLNLKSLSCQLNVNLIFRILKYVATKQSFRLIFLQDLPVFILTLRARLGIIGSIFSPYLPKERDLQEDQEQANTNAFNYQFLLAWVLKLFLLKELVLVFNGECAKHLLII